MTKMAILKNAPAGNAGDVSRIQETNVEPVRLGEVINAFGVPCKFDLAGNTVMMGTGDAGSAFKGILTRIVPSISGSVAEGFTDGKPAVDTIQGLVRSGYVMVNCKVGNPIKGGKVYVRVVASGGKALGDIEASSDSTNSVELPNAEWATSGKDADGIAELFIKY